MTLPINTLEQLVGETLQILSKLGVPLDGSTDRRNNRMAKTVLAVAGLKVGMSWVDAQSNATGHQLVSRQILRYMNEHLGENIADSSYDDIRRKDLVLPVEAGIVIKSALNPTANTNDGTRAYALNPEVACIMHKFGTSEWEDALKDYLGSGRTLAEELQRERDLARLPVKIREGVELHFSSGEHNELQKRIIEEFLPLYGYGAEVLYVGDASNKYLYLDETKLRELNFYEIAHDKLPDVVAYSQTRNWLYLIEAVHTSNPVTELRRLILQRVTKDCTADIIYVTAFNDRATFRKFAGDIAWETEVWIADAPEHLIHFNGDKFMGPYTS